MSRGLRSMFAPLRRVLVRTPGETFGSADPERWHYRRRPDLSRARREHADLVALLRASGVGIVDIGDRATDSADAIYVHDPSCVIEEGALLLRMGKALRRGEVDDHAGLLGDRNVPVLGRLTGAALAEGGDLLWLDGSTLAVGQGFRTNAEGCRQLAAALGPLGVEVVPVPLPWHTGPAACLHLMSIVSVVDRDLAVAYRPLLPVPFVARLEQAGMTVVDVPAEEWDTQGPNVLAVAPRDCILLENNVETARRLERAGCRVRTYRGDEISLNAEGGPTCLTRPLARG